MVIKYDYIFSTDFFINKKHVKLKYEVDFKLKKYSKMIFYDAFRLTIDRFISLTFNIWHSMNEFSFLSKFFIFSMKLQN